jgi:hypothetical protein
MAASTIRAQQAEVSTADTPAAERDTADLLLDILQEISELRESVAQLTDAVAAIQLELTERRPGIVPGARPADAPAIGAGSGPSASPLQDPAAPPKSVLQAPEERVFSVTLVKEWGRSIEEAQRLSTTSLVGQVLAVPPWSTREELENLGKELRAKFAAYDNVNIEVFNDRAVAASYAERPVALNAAARVLTVSKVLDSGRDKILLFVDGDVIEVQ